MLSNLYTVMERFHGEDEAIMSIPEENGTKEQRLQYYYYILVISYQGHICFISLPAKLRDHGELKEPTSNVFSSQKKLAGMSTPQRRLGVYERRSR